jgi:DNA replication and repair protein RecF
VQIQTLKLQNFRNHKNLELEFDPTTTLIIGPNGRGKTNILESIYLLSVSKSPRTRYDRDLIAYGQEFCTITAEVTSNGDETTLDLQVIASKTHENVSSKRVKVNKVAKTHKVFNTMFNAVLFMPEDIRILTGSPSKRRKYMDLTLAQIDYEYKKNHSDYIKAARQRNKLLFMIKETGRGQDQLEFWNEKLLKTGQYLQKNRQTLINFFKEALQKNGNNILKNGNVIQIEYLKNEISPERLAEYETKEIAAKTTLVGPHRDDFVIRLDGHDIAQFGSRGQQRSTLLALKLSEIEFIQAETEKTPVLLLDDIFSELDETHRDRVMEAVQQQQTIVTSTEEQLSGKYKLIQL